MHPIRRATTADIAPLLELWTRADAEPTHTDDPESLARLLSRDPDALLVAVDGDGRLVGSVIAGWDGWRGSIYRLVVAPERRRAGLGRRLLHAAEDRFRDLAAARCQAVVVSTDERAVSFWRASGWEQQVERVRFVLG